MATTQAALLGCDHPHSKGHLGTLRSLTEVTRIHLWDPEPQAAEALAAQIGDKPVTVHRDLAGVLSDPAVGWVLASVRNDLSADLLRRCAEAGKPALSEKPMGRSYAEVKPVVDAFRQRGLSLAVQYVNRSKPAVMAMRELVTGGRIGRICSAETRLHTTSVRLRNPRHWLFDRALSGGGILPWLGCHHLDLFSYVMAAEPVSVTAHCATLSGEEVDVEDMVAMTIEFDNGALATATFGYLMPGGETGNSFASKDTYFGLKGTLGQVAFEPTGSPQVVEAVSYHEDWIGAPARRLVFHEDPDPAYGNKPGREFARLCLEAALRGEDGPATGEDMLRTWATMEAAYQAQEQGVRVAL